MTIEPSKIYVPNEVAEILRCGKSSVYQLASQGSLASFRVGANGGGVRFRGEDILAFLDSTKKEVVPRKKFKYLRL